MHFAERTWVLFVASALTLVGVKRSLVRTPNRNSSDRDKLGDFGGTNNRTLHVFDAIFLDDGIRLIDACLRMLTDRKVVVPTFQKCELVKVMGGVDVVVDQVAKLVAE